MPACDQAIFNDLQLVCYQLGLMFPELAGRGRSAAVMPIAQSGLFYVHRRMTSDAPESSNSQEGMYQPPLFADGAV